MNISDLKIGNYVVVNDLGASKYSSGMRVMGKVVSIDPCGNSAIIESLPKHRYEITDFNYFELWSKQIEDKTERMSEDSIPKPGQKYYFDDEDFGPHILYKINNQSNDVQQRKRKDNVNSPSHYMLGNHEVKDIVSLVADKYHKGSVAHNIASALEYQMRAPEKNGLEDIKKARKCLDFAIENWDVK